MVGFIKTIMVVDEERTMLQEVKDYLDNEEYQVITVHNSREALELMNETNDFDLILVNTSFPGSKKKAFFSIRPKIKEETDNDDDFLQKPFTREQLVSFVKHRM